MMQFFKSISIKMKGHKREEIQHQLVSLEIKAQTRFKERSSKNYIFTSQVSGKFIKLVDMGILEFKFLSNIKVKASIKFIKICR